MRPDSGAVPDPTPAPVEVVDVTASPAPVELVVPGSVMEYEIVAATTKPVVEIVPEVTTAPYTATAAIVEVPVPSAMPAAIPAATAEPRELHLRAYRPSATPDVVVMDVFATKGPLSAVAADTTPTEPTQAPPTVAEPTQEPSALVLRAPYDQNVVATPLVVPLEAIVTAVPSPEVVSVSFSHNSVASEPAPALAPVTMPEAQPYSRSVVEATTEPMPSPESALVQAPFSRNAVTKGETVLPTAIPIPTGYSTSSSGSGTLSLMLQ